jgi:hypothetical protein
VSFSRQIYFAAMLAGWAALFGWVVCEFVILPASGGASWEAIPSAGMVGASIGAGVGAAAALAGGWNRLLLRAVAGGAGGLIGGLLGGAIGQLLYWIGLPQWLGWVVIGIGIGGTDALFERDARRLRNGLIGGLLGGLAGGVLFRLISIAVPGSTGMTARAIGFVAIGIAIGAMVGLVQVLLRNAWLTVIDGDGAGRQFLLSGSVAPLGSSSAASLVIAGPGIEPEHARLTRSGAGYFIEDNRTPGGTLLNDRPVTASSALANGDVIRIGSTYLRFNMAAQGSVADTSEPPKRKVQPVSAKPPEPPKTKAVPPPPQAKPEPPRAAPLPTRPLPSAPPKPIPEPPRAAPIPPRPQVVPPPPPPPPMARGAICSECGEPVSGKPGMRICNACGAIS